MKRLALCYPLVLSLCVISCALFDKQYQFERTFLGKELDYKVNLMGPSIDFFPVLLHPKYIESKTSQYAADYALTRIEYIETKSEYIDLFRKVSFYVVMSVSISKESNVSYGEMSSMIDPKYWRFYLFDARGKRYTSVKKEVIEEWFSDEGVSTIITPEISGLWKSLTKPIGRSIQNGFIIQFDPKLSEMSGNIRLLAASSAGKREFAFDLRKMMGGQTVRKKETTRKKTQVKKIPKVEEPEREPTIQPVGVGNVTDVKDMGGPSHIIYISLEKYQGILRGAQITIMREQEQIAVFSATAHVGDKIVATAPKESGVRVGDTAFLGAPK